MTTWIVGDIHGCAEELDRLLRRLDPGPGDHLISTGDLLHRGPDPGGVIDLLERCGARFVLGNHELAVLRRVGLAPPAAGDRPPLRGDFPEIDAEDLRGDGDLPCEVEPWRRADVLRFLQRHSGYSLSSRSLETAAGTLDGRDWWVVHAGLLPGFPIEESPVEALVSLRHLHVPGHPWWYEAWRGPELVLFGHTPSPLPRAHRIGGRLLALGLDTGCVFGGSLTAYSPELDEYVSVKAARSYARV